MNRAEALETLKEMAFTAYGHRAEALDMAIASLKTDEAYQLEYENRDFVEIPEGMTNGEVMNHILRKVFPRIIFIRAVNEWNKTKSIVYSEEWENKPYKAER